MRVLHSWKRVLPIAGLAVILAGGYALAQTVAQESDRWVVDPNSPSDVMMEQCATAGLGPEGHTQMWKMIDGTHGTGAHRQMHQAMDGMMRGGAMGSGMMGDGTMDPGSPTGSGIMRGMISNGV